MDAPLKAGLLGLEALAGALICDALWDGDQSWLLSDLGQSCLLLLGYNPDWFMRRAQRFERPIVDLSDERRAIVQRWERLRQQGQSAKEAAKTMGYSTKRLYAYRSELQDMIGH